MQNGKGKGQADENNTQEGLGCVGESPPRCCVSKGKAKQLVIMTLTSEKLLETRSAYLNKLDHEAKKFKWL